MTDSGLAFVGFLLAAGMSGCGGPEIPEGSTRIVDVLGSPTRVITLGLEARSPGEPVLVLFAGGGYRHGQHIAHDRDHNTPLCNLFVTMLQSMGMEMDSFGQSTGALTWS